MTLKDQLLDAQQRYHELLTGVSARVVVDQNGERVEYTAANRSALAQYIAELEKKIGGNTVKRGPLKAWFNG